MKKIQKNTRGTSAAYTSRNKALKKLQISLALFRKLCILKGIYPRQPSNIKKASGKGSTANTTYYYAKDIQYLLHEPLLNQFRQYKIYQNKLKKAIGKKEWEKAANIEKHFKPSFKLDHIIKQRYPSFIHALRDLDDALSMVFLFSTLPSQDKIPNSKVNECKRLSQEFLAFVAKSQQLEKVFVSIKGIYYQATIRGQPITWIQPHQFTQTLPADVDFKIMATFLDLYIQLLSFVNYKLFTDAGIVYPPKIDAKKDESGSGLMSYLLESDKPLVDIVKSLPDSGDVKDKMDQDDDDESREKMESVLSKLPEKIAQLSAKEEAQGDETGATTTTTEIGIKTVDMVDSDDDDQETNTDHLPTLQELTAASDNAQQFKNLFKGNVFFLSRETPLHTLQFLIKSFGGQVGWESPSSPYSVKSSKITHHVVDRPVPVGADRPAWMQYEDAREYIQPQWILDCINAKKLLKTKGYHPGETLPPHLSPFEVYEDGDYVPDEAKKIFGVSAVAVAKGIEGGEVETLVEEEQEEEEQEEEEAIEEDKDIDEDEDQDEEDMYTEELRAEAAGLTYTEYMQQKEEKEAAAGASGKRKSKPSTVQEKVNKKAKNEEQEKKNLAMSMMTKKDRRLYDQIQYGKDKKKKVFETLVSKKKNAKKQAKAGFTVGKKEE